MYEGQGNDDCATFEEEGGSGDGSGCCGACCAFLLGVFLLPAALFVLGWNENNFVCERNRIIVAQDTAEVIGCDDRAQVGVGGLYFFSCPIQKSSLKTFTPSDFTAVDGNIDVPAMTTVAASMQAEMLLCKESCEEQKYKNAAGQNKKRTVCHYKLSWSDTYESGTHFRSMDAAARGCMRGQLYYGNPPEPSGNLLSASGLTRHSPAPVEVGDPTGGYELNQELVDRLYPDVDVDLSDWSTRRAYTGAYVDSSVPTTPFAYSAQTLKVSGGYLKSCDFDVLGCIRIKFRKSDVYNPSVIAAIGPDGMTKAYPMPAAWGCSGRPWQAILGAAMTKAEFIADLNASNSAQVWMIRLGGLLCCWFAIFLCFSPFLYAVDCIGSVVNWLPCGGYLQDALENVASGIACAISCPLGCSCGLFVISLVWLFMRPLYGGLLMAVCLCCCAAAVGVRGTYTKPPGRRKQVTDAGYSQF